MKLYQFILSSTLFINAHAMSSVAAPLPDGIILIKSNSNHTTELAYLRNSPSDGKMIIQTSMVTYCIQYDGSECKMINTRSEIVQNLSHSLGLSAPPSFIGDGQRFPERITLITRNSIVNQTGAEADITFSIQGKEQTNHVILEVPKGFSGVRVNPLPPKTSEASRWQIKNRENTELESYLGSIVRLYFANSNRNGTGFFISPSGHLLTNYHVINDDPDCIKTLICRFEVQIEDALSRRDSKKIIADLLLADRKRDVALVQLRNFETLGAKSLKLGGNQVGPYLFTIGFPDDKSSATYSSGNLTGFRGHTFSSSILAFAGASGSPIIDSQTGLVVGLLSKGASAGQSPGPILFEPIHDLEYIFRISEYLNNSKPVRIATLMRELSLTSNLVIAKRLLRDFEQERTLLGLDQLQSLVINHPSSSIRYAILQTLEEIGAIK